MRIISKKDVENEKIQKILAKIRRNFNRPPIINIEESIDAFASGFMTSDVNDKGEKIAYYYNDGKYQEYSWGDIFMITPIVDFAEIKDKISNLQEVTEKDGTETGLYSFTYGESPTKEIYRKQEIFKKISNNEIKATGQKYVLCITKEGKKYEASIYQDIITGEKYIIYIDSDLTVRDPSITERFTNNENIKILRFEPITWYLDEDKHYAIPDCINFFGEFRKDYQTSPLATFLESDDFLSQIGLQAPKIIENVEDKSPIKKMFHKGRQEHLKLDEKIRRVLYGGKRVPYIVGHPGIGKTQIAKSLSKNVLCYNVSTFQPDTFTGKTGIVPGKETTIATANGMEKTTEKGSTFVTKPEWYIQLEQLSKKCAENNERCILFLDEFDKLPPNMQIFINGIVDDPRSIAGWIIPDNVDIVLAGNTEEYSQASISISGEVASRLTRMEVEPNVYDWLEWAAKHDVDQIVLAYINLNPSKLLYDAKDEAGDYDYSKSLNPRSWDQKISETLKTGRAYGEFPDLKDIMPKEEISQFESFVELYCELDIEGIINGDYSIIPSIKNDPQSFYFVLNCIVPLIYTEEQLTDLFTMFKNEDIPKEYIQNFKYMWLQIFREAEDIQRLRIVEEEFNQGKVIGNV